MFSNKRNNFYDPFPNNYRFTEQPETSNCPRRRPRCKSNCKLNKRNNRNSEDCMTPPCRPPWPNFGFVQPVETICFGNSRLQKANTHQTIITFILSNRKMICKPQKKSRLERVVNIFMFLQHVLFPGRRRRHPNLRKHEFYESIPKNTPNQRTAWNNEPFATTTILKCQRQRWANKLPNVNQLHDTEQFTHHRQILVSANRLTQNVLGTRVCNNQISINKTNRSCQIYMYGEEPK